MNRRLVALGIVAIVAVAGVTIVLVIDPLGTSFHLEQKLSAFPQDLRDVVVSLHTLSNCNVSVTFVNDTSLLYRIDISLYSAALMSSAFALSVAYDSTSYGLGVALSAYVPMSSLSLVLGTGKPYDLYIDGTNLTTNVVYGNGSLLGHILDSGQPAPNVLSYDATGTFKFQLLGDVKASQAGLLVETHAQQTTNLALIYVHLPPDLHGRLAGQRVVVTSLAGRWSNWTAITLPTYTYATEYSTPEPRIAIATFSWAVTANLS